MVKEDEKEREKMKKSGKSKTDLLLSKRSGVFKVFLSLLNILVLFSSFILTVYLYHSTL